MEVECHRGMMENEHIAIGSNSYVKVKTFKYLGSLSKNQKFIDEEIECRFKAGNSRHYSVQTLLSSRLLSKNFKIKIYTTIAYPAVCIFVDILREESGLRVFESRIQRRVFGARRMRMGNG